MSRDVVFTVQVGRTVSAETWAKFLERVLAAGRTESPKTPWDAWRTGRSAMPRRRSTCRGPSCSRARLARKRTCQQASFAPDLRVSVERDSVAF
jgi:hypothetical protein